MAGSSTLCSPKDWGTFEGGDDAEVMVLAARRPGQLLVDVAGDGVQDLLDRPGHGDAFVFFGGGAAPFNIFAPLTLDVSFGLSDPRVGSSISTWTAGLTSAPRRQRRLGLAANAGTARDSTLPC